MKKKSSKPIGYLIDLLGISVTVMADKIYIDRTIISKWKTGSRTLNIESVHYTNVIEYLIAENQRLGLKTLERLFSNLYPDEDIHDANYLKICINKFLSDKMIPYAAEELAFQAHHSLYYNNVATYCGSDGRWDAFKSILNMMEQSEERYKLILFDTEYFDWILKEESYNQQWLEQLKRILKKGHQVINIICLTTLTKYFENYYYYCYTLNNFLNYEEYFFNTPINLKLFTSSYLIKGKILLQGQNATDRYDEMYTAIYKDHFTIYQATAYLEFLQQMSTTPSCPTTTMQRINTIKTMIQHENMKDICYLYTESLTFTTLEESLFLDILQENNITGDMYHAITTLYFTIRNLQESSYDTPFYRHICYQEFLQEYVKKDKIYLNELSLLTGKKIYISNEHFRHHLRNTAELVKQKKNYCIGFGNNMKLKNARDFNCRCKRNLHYIFLSNTTKMTSDTTIVSPMFELIDTFWNNSISKREKESSYISELLLTIANS